MGSRGGIVVTIIACGWTQNGGTGGTAKRGLPERQRENENAKEIELKERKRDKRHELSRHAILNLTL